MSYANFVQCQIVLPLTAGANSITLVAPPAPYQLPPEDGGILVLADSPNRPTYVEVIRYTGRIGLALNGVTRGLEGTAARGWSGVAFVYQPMTAGGLQETLDSKLDTTGTAASATKLATARTINDVSFDGTADITIGADWSNLTSKPATYAPSEHGHAMSDVAGLTAALGGKQDALVSGANLKTVNGESLLGTGDIEVEGGLTLFEESLNTASPNATVPVHALTALGAETNIDFVIAPKGTGAIVAQIPDGTIAGGNKRGARAVDLQTHRSSASRVASGSYSVAMGTENVASANYSVAIGHMNTASASYAVAIGGGNTAAGSCAVAMGYTSGAHGLYSVAMGYATLANSSNTVAMGSGTIAGGSNSVAMGNNTSTRGITSCFATGDAASSGVQQMVSYPLRYNTGTDAATQLTVNGGAPSPTNTPVMPNSSAYYCRLRVLARNLTTNASMSWSGTALIKRGANAASTTLIGSAIASDFGDAAMSACTVTLSADTTRGCLAVMVTGLASTNIRWVAQLETVEAA